MPPAPNAAARFTVSVVAPLPATTTARSGALPNNRRKPAAWSGMPPNPGWYESSKGGSHDQNRVAAALHAATRAHYQRHLRRLQREHAAAFGAQRALQQILHVRQMQILRHALAVCHVMQRQAMPHGDVEHGTQVDAFVDLGQDAA